MLTSFFCAMLTACALRARLTLLQVLTAIAFLYISFHYLVPFSQYGRSLVPENPTFGQRISIAAELLEQPEKTRRAYYEQENSVELQNRGLSAYYDTPQGFWERLQMISPDDRLNAVTDRGVVFGLMPIQMAFLNAIPHVIWKDKPSFNLGNAYAHDITGQPQGEGDLTTGISFSPTGEAYHLAKWTGVLVIAPLLLCLLFIIFDSLVGDLRSSPWGLLALYSISFIAPEGGLNGLIYMTTFGVEVIVFCALFATFVAPILANFFIGPEKMKLRELQVPIPNVTHQVER